MSFEFLTVTVGPRALLLWCLDLPIENALGVKNWEGVVGFWLLTFRGSNFCAKLHQNRTQNATVGVTTDRQTEDRQKDASGFIICPMLCYSNGTDKNMSRSICIMSSLPCNVTGYQLHSAVFLL